MTEKRLWTKGEKKGYGMIAGAWSHWRSRCSSREAGQVLILVALAIFVFIGSVALAVDIGFFRYKKRDMQKAADAGAIGGATERMYNVSNTDSGAKRDTSRNGFTHGQDGVIVTVNNPPESGPHKNLPEKDHYVEVIIEQDQPTFFARVFGINSSKVTARAVARGGMEVGEACIYALNEVDRDAFMVRGGAYVKADCSVCISSVDDQAFSVGGGPPYDPSKVESTGSITVAGGYEPIGSGIATPDPIEGGPICENPLDWLTPPPAPICSTKTAFKVTGVMNVPPGTYCGGIDVLAGATATFLPGEYILDGGLHAAAGSSLQGTDVFFYNYGTGAGTDGDIVLNGVSTTNLSAPTSGPYQGVLFFQDRNNTKNAKFNGSSDMTLNGALYFPSALVTMEGNFGSTVGSGMIVADTLKFSGQADFSIIGEDDSGTVNNPPVLRIVLVE